MSINWSDLRSLNGSQRIAFEELCSQLARYESVPENSLFIRKGSPDAGVECYWKLPNGEEWAWQVKFFRDTGVRGLWQQIEESIKRALEKHPRLVAYTICLPFDRPDARIEEQESFMDKWNQHVDKWKNWAHKKGMSVEFHYWGNSEIFDRLGREEQRGRYFFWFNHELFSNNWFNEKIEENITAVGPRYTPELNIELPISRLFDGLGRTSRFYTKMKVLYGKLNRAYQRTRSRKGIVPIKDQFESIEKQIIQLLSLLNNIGESETAYIDWEQIGTLISSVGEEIWKCEQKLREIYETNNPNLEIPGNASREQIGYTIYEIREMSRLLSEIGEFGQSPEAHLLNVPALLIVGDAGTGKTHLLCDVAKQRAGSNLPTILLLGNHFTDADPWRQILDILDLSCTRDMFLGALQAAAQAKGRKALILIDALNEGEGKTLWRKRITSMLKVLSRFDWISVAFSVRTSYVTTVIPKGLTPDLLIKHVHTGFGGVEYQAIRTFFKYYGIALPSVPLLIPEFRNPLFLKLFCEGLRNYKSTSVPPDLKGMTRVYEFFISSINQKLHYPEYLDFNPKREIIWDALNSLAKMMSERSTNWLMCDEAESVVNGILPREGYEKSLFRHMISEGILTEDRFRTKEGDTVDGIHFVYERFSDYIIANNLLKQLDMKNPTQSFELGKPLGELLKNEQTCYMNNGIIEAFSILLPEKIHKELPELVSHAKDFDPVIDAFIDSLMWRNPEAIGEGTLKLIKECVMNEHRLHRFLNVLLTAAPNPAHPYNAHYLHELLMRHEINKRDAWWSTFLHYQYETDSPLDRLIDWALSFEDKGHIDDEPILLSGIALSWFLTSSNRFLRDSTTKALISLFTPRMNLLEKLIMGFLDVNDPYVLERLFAVAYGCCMRSQDNEAICTLAASIYNWIFSNKTPPPHILLRDYARGSIEIALHRGCSINIDVKKIRPPCASEWISDVPSKEEIEKFIEREPLDSDAPLPPSEKSKLALYLSVISWGDFARYIVGTNSPFFDWCNIPIEDTVTIYDMDEHRFDLPFVQRWILKKVIDLGWTADLFGEFDHLIDRRNMGRSAHKAERIGKKYQWLAFHEVLARISDNFRFVGGPGNGEKEVYVGPWQMHHRDIDPSFLLRKTQSQTWEIPDSTWWFPSTYREWKTEPDDMKWIKNFHDLPDIKSLLEVTDPENDEHWFVLQSFYHYEEPIPPEEERFEKPRREITYNIMGHIVKKENLEEFAEWANEELQWEQAFVRLAEFYYLFMGELFRSPAYSYYTREDRGYFEWRREYPQYSKKLLVPCDIYKWESNTFDCSIDEHISIYIPSKWLAKQMGLKWSGIESQFNDKNDNLVTFDPSVFSPGPSAFLVNKNKLREFLDHNKLGILWIVRGEKRIIPPFSNIKKRQASLKIKAIYYIKDGEIRELPPRISLGSN